ncbi:OsmC/Ohr family [Zopfochytrium polystomum]|nr:OsmC/Ohr family [Zopfochytrium polystomum]
MSGSDEPGIGPMKLLLLGVGGCAAVDLVSILKKQRQAVASVRIRVEGQRARDMPRPFVAVHTTFVVTGKGLDRAKVERAVELSLEKYCGVHGTLAAGVKHLTWGAETRELE